MARNGRASKYIVNLYNGKTEHRLTLTYTQKERLVKAWKDKEENFRLIIDNGNVFFFNFTLFEVLSYAPLPEPIFPE